MHILSLNKGMETSINAESFSKSLLTLIQYPPASSRQQTLRNIKRTMRQLDYTLKGLWLNLENGHSMKAFLFHLPSLKFGNTSMKERKFFMSMLFRTCQKISQKVFKSNLLYSRNNMVLVTKLKIRF